MIIYCSKALETALKLSKTDFATPEQLATEVNPFYAWHGHIAKVDGRNTIVLMNDKTMYCLLFRNKLPRNKDKFAELVMEALPYTLEVGNINKEEIVNYMSHVDNIVFAEKADRQITGNITRMILDMGYSWEYEWREDETIQAYEAYEQNRLLRKIGKDYIVPFEEMLKALCGIHE
ncbi:TPA: hypothetical protein ACGPAZ_001316 [Streptococcus suis]